MPSILLSSLLLLSTSFLPRIDAKSLEFIPNAYIVEFDAKSAPIPEVKLQGKLEAYLSDVHAGFHDHLRKRGVSYKVRQEFHEPAIFSGVSVRLANASLLGELHAAPNVKSVYRTRVVTNPNLNLNVKVVGQKQTASANVYAPHVMTGVNRLHAQGYYGKGVKIAILDTGVDYKHPALGGCFGPKCRVSFGTDLVGDAYTGSNDPSPDSDPYSNCGAHGTHVTGIIAANSTALGFTGVAPQATIGSYRVFGCTGSSGDDVLMDAMLTAFRDKADIISMSIGMPSGWSESPLSVVASKIVEQGTILVASQGNEASSGMFFSSGPASGKGVISVASVDNTKFTAYTAKTSINRDITYLAAISFNQTSQPIRYFNEGCTAASYPSGTTLKNVVALVKRGSCPLADKARYAARAGASAILIYNSDLPPVVPESSQLGIKSALISKTDGEALVAAIAKGTVTISFPAAKAFTVNNDGSGGKVSDFSTYGPNYNLDTANPAISAPGGAILSTWPVRLGSYAIISGTSMAAPYIAGAAAVFLSAKGNNAAMRKAFPAIMTTTAVPVANYSSGSTTLNTVIQQGGGLLNLSHAFTASSIVTPQMLFLNDTTNFAKSQKFQIKNRGKAAVEYTVTHLPAGTALALDTDGKNYFRWPVPLVGNKAGVRFTSTRFTVQPGRTVTVTATFTAPSGLNAKQQPIYSGFISIKSSAEKEPYQIPYYGLAAPISSQTILYRDADRYKHTLPALTDSNNNFQDSTKSYTFRDQDYPRINFYLQSGTAYLAIDVVRSDATGLPANPRSRARSLTAEEEETPVEERSFGEGFGAIPSMDDGLNLMPRAVAKVQVPSDLLRAAVTKKPFNTLGQVAGGSGSYLARSDGDSYNFPWTGGIVDPTTGNSRAIENGSYRLFLTALKISGDPSKASDYETWLSPIIVVNRS